MYSRLGRNIAGSKGTVAIVANRARKLGSVGLNNLHVEWVRTDNAPSIVVASVEGKHRNVTNLQEVLVSGMKQTYLCALSDTRTISKRHGVVGVFLVPQDFNRARRTANGLAIV